MFEGPFGPWGGERIGKVSWTGSRGVSALVKGQGADAICPGGMAVAGEGWTGPRGLWEVELTGFGMQEWTGGMVRTISDFQSEKVNVEEDWAPLLSCPAVPIGGSDVIDHAPGQ